MLALCQMTFQVIPLLQTNIQCQNKVRINENKAPVIQTICCKVVFLHLDIPIKSTMLSIILGLHSCKYCCVCETIGNCLKIHLMRGQHNSVTDVTWT